MKDNNFIYSENIQEIKPLTINLSFHLNKNKEIICYLRRKFIIREENSAFWKEFFTGSLSRVPIKTNLLVKFSNANCDDPSFCYSENIAEVNPLILNLTLTKPNGVKTGDLRKKIPMLKKDAEFWGKVIMAMLLKEPIETEVLIEFRNPGLSALKIKQWGLLKEGIKINL